jgi:hypothetical protein
MIKIANLEVKLAIIGSIVGAILLLVTLYLNKGYGLAITLLIACGAYLLYHRFGKSSIGESETNEISNGLAKLSNRAAILAMLIYCTLISLTGVIIINYLYGTAELPVWFFAIMFAAAIILLYLIFLFRNNVNDNYVTIVMLFSIALFATVFLMCRIFIYPEIKYTGYSDHLFHWHFIDTIMSTNFANQDMMPIYNNYPVGHIWVSICALISNIINYNYATLVFILVPYIFNLIVIYLLFSKITNRFFSIMAIFFTSLNTWYFYYGYFLIPMVFSTIYLLLIIYLYSYKKIDIKKMLLIIFLTVNCIFTHPFTGIVLIIFTLSYLIVKYMLNVISGRQTISISRNYFLFVLVSVTAFIIYLLHNHLAGQIYYMEYTLTHIGVLGLTSSKPTIIFELESLNSYIYYLFLIIAIFYFIKYFNKLNTTKFFILTSVTIIIIFINLGYVSGLKALLPYRWALFSALLISYPVIEGIFFLTNKIKRIEIKYILLSFIVLLLIISISFNVSINEDFNAEYTYQIQRSGLTLSDISMQNFIDSNIHDDGYTYGLIYRPFHHLSLYKYNLYQENEISNISTMYNNGKLYIHLS